MTGPAGDPWLGWQPSPSHCAPATGAGGGWGAGHAGGCGGWGKPGFAGRSVEFSVGIRMWSDSCAVLDLEARPEGYKLWKNKGKGFLLSKFPKMG